MTSRSVKEQAIAPVCALLLLTVAPIRELNPSAVLWTAPAILFAAMFIAWAAESAQFFIAQGFALAILAWLQTLPEFAVEAVLAWKQQVPLLLANLTGALRLLTGLGWPMIYLTAAVSHRLRYQRPLREIKLAQEQCVEVIALLSSMSYAFLIWWKDSLNLVDAFFLIAIYVVYLLVLWRIPPEKPESIEELELIPRSIVKARAPVRIGAIAGLFALGGGLIYFTAEPFLGSLLALSSMLRIPRFVFVQWVAPFVSEFPETLSSLYWARTIDRASTALMSMVSSNINQWTLLTAMLAIVYSSSRGVPSSIFFDSRQELEILMTLGQSLVGTLFLINMRLTWKQAAALFVLWAVQFGFSFGAAGGNMHVYVTWTYWIWAGVEVVRMLQKKRQPLAFQAFGVMWRQHIRP